MLSRASLRTLTLLSTVSASVASFGIVATTTYGATPDTMYPYVGYVDGFGGSGVAVGPNAFLTAGHVVGGGISNGNSSQTFTLGGTTYSLASSVAAPDILLGNGMMGHVDLTLVYVNGTFPGYYNIGTSYVPGSAVTMVGYGQTGGVSSDGLGYYVNFTSGQRLSGVNTLDAAGDYYVAPGTTGLNGTAGGPNFQSYLSRAGDAALGGGDSGGGWFQGNTLVGISDYVFNDTQPDAVDPAKYRYYGFASANTSGFNSVTDAPNYTGMPYTIPAGTEYSGSGAINVTDPRLSAFFAPLRPQATPEPGTVAALGFGALALLRRRSRRA